MIYMLNDYIPTFDMTKTLAARNFMRVFQDAINNVNSFDAIEVFSFVRGKFSIANDTILNNHLIGL